MEDLYCEKTANRIIELIREGKSEAKICKMQGMPAARTLSRWKKKHPEFLEATIEARRFSAELYNDRRMELVDELIDQAREHELSGTSFSRGTVEALRAAMQELAREAAIRDDTRFSDRHKVIAEVSGSAGGEGMAAVYEKMREAMEARKEKDGS